LCTDIVSQSRSDAAADGAGAQWDVDAATKDSGELDFSALNSDPRGIYVSDDGTKVFIGSQDDRKIYQYTMATAYDLSTATKDAAELDISTEVGAGALSGFTMKPDGTVLYALESGAPSTAYQYTLSTAWDLSSGSYANKSGTVARNQDIAISSDGTKVFSCDTQTVGRHTLSSAWDISTIGAESQTLSVSAKETGTSCMVFGDSGEKLYISGSANATVYQWTLSTADDLTSASADSNSLDVSSTDAGPEGLWFNSDGTRLFVAGSTNKKAFSYTLTGGTASLTWKAAPRRFDTLGGATPQYVLRRTSGSTAPVIVTGKHIRS